MAPAVPPEFLPTLFSGAAPPSGGVVIFRAIHASCRCAPAMTRVSDDQGQRQTTAVSKQAALDASFAAVGRVRADFFPRPQGPWSSSHRAPASPSRSSRALRTPAGPRARSAQIRLHRSTRETVDGPKSANTSPWHRALPMACRCAATTRWRPSRPGQGCEGGGSPMDAVSAVESMVPSVPTSHRSSASHHHAAHSSPCPPNRESRTLDKQTASCFNLPRKALVIFHGVVSGLLIL